MSFEHIPMYVSEHMTGATDCVTREQMRSDIAFQLCDKVYEWMVQNGHNHLSQRLLKRYRAAHRFGDVRPIRIRRGLHRRAYRRTPPRKIRFRASGGIQVMLNRSDTGKENAMSEFVTTEFDSIYGSKYLNATDLNGSTQKRRIRSADIAELREKDGSTKRKLVIGFDGSDKIMALNKTNASRLAQTYGKNHHSWVGAEIELYVEDTQFGPGVRIRPLQKQQTAAKPVEQFDDNIPF